MDRVAVILLFLTVVVALVLVILALFAVAPVFCSCLASLLYTLYLFIAYDARGVHHAQEFENRFWTIFSIMLSTTVFFAHDSPFAIGRWSVGMGFLCVLLCGFGMHWWDRYSHRKRMTRDTGLKRTRSGASSLVRLQELGIPIEEKLAQINANLADIDKLLIPSTINNLLNHRLVMGKEREIINIFEEAEQKALNYLIGHSKLPLIFYKVKDHRPLSGKHRTRLIELLAVERISMLTVISKVLVLHALQMMTLPANPRSEYWVQNVILSTHLDELSEMKSLMDAKGDYFSMKKLIFDDVKSETVRQGILRHFQKEASVQQAHMAMKTKMAKIRSKKAWRKILSDIDDTLTSSGGSYPAGVDRRYGRKVVYPGVLAFYRELDLGIEGPDEWPPHAIGNLVFLSARPHVYKDVSEKRNFAKFEKLRARGAEDGRSAMHTVPSLLSGDISSGRDYLVTNDMEPLALKKFENFELYVSIYPEFRHVFICDNGQGDVRAAELMFDRFPEHLEEVYIHVVQDISKTHGYDRERWRAKKLKACFFRSYPEAALHAATQSPPRVKLVGLQRVCQEAVHDFYTIPAKLWPSPRHKRDRRNELNQAIWRANGHLLDKGFDAVPLIKSERMWHDGEKVRTPYGIGTIKDFDPVFDMYRVELDWRPLDVQVRSFEEEQKALRASESSPQRVTSRRLVSADSSQPILETVDEAAEDIDEENTDHASSVATPEEASFHGAASIASDDPSFAVRDLTRRSREKSKVEKGQDGDLDNCLFKREIVVTLQGRHISKFTPPVIPVLEKGILGFSFWAADSSKSKSRTMSPGDRCETPYGPGTVVEWRRRSRVVVVDFLAWRGRGYLPEDTVKVVAAGIIGSVLRRIGRMDSGGDSAVSHARGSKAKDPDFLYAKGTALQTPFGTGIVSRPLSFHDDRQQPAKIDPDRVHPKTKAEPTSRGRPAVATVGISITSWKLADGTHPVLYCTAEQAREWKRAKMDGTNKQGTFLSAIDKFVSSFRGIIQPSEKRLSPVPPDPKPLPGHDQYFLDSAAVVTSYGIGVVKRFRQSDGVYEVSLVDWKLANGTVALAYVRKGELRHRVAEGCQEGYPVLTNLGVSGNLASVEPTTGTHIVTVPSAGMICYIRPECILQPLKAAVGDEVVTNYGEGIVRRFRKEDAVYEISLRGCNAQLYAKAEAFDRIADGTNDRDEPFGMNWLLRLLFFTSNSTKGGGDTSVPGGSVQRSRSNSVAAHSVFSQG